MGRGGVGRGPVEDARARRIDWPTVFAWVCVIGALAFAFVTWGLPPLMEFAMLGEAYLLPVLVGAALMFASLVALALAERAALRSPLADDHALRVWVHRLSRMRWLGVVSVAVLAAGVAVPEVLYWDVPVGAYGRAIVYGGLFFWAALAVGLIAYGVLELEVLGLVGTLTTGRSRREEAARGEDDCAYDPDLPMDVELAIKRLSGETAEAVPPWWLLLVPGSVDLLDTTREHAVKNLVQGIALTHVWKGLWSLLPLLLWGVGMVILAVAGIYVE